MTHHTSLYRELVASTLLQIFERENFILPCQPVEEVNLQRAISGPEPSRDRTTRAPVIEKVIKKLNRKELICHESLSFPVSRTVSEDSEKRSSPSIEAEALSVPE